MTDILEHAVQRLTAENIEVGINPYTSAGVVILAEACNWAAKVIDRSFYDMKESLILEALEFVGVAGFYDRSEGVVGLYAAGSGTAWFHVFDPRPEFLELPPWEWHGQDRQSMAFHALAGVPEVLEHYRGSV